jgi:excinuclease UvrABC ATPase subunit
MNRRGLSLVEVLAMPIEEARDFFTERKVVYHKYNEVAPPVEEVSLEEQARTY